MSWVQCIKSFSAQIEWKPQSLMRLHPPIKHRFLDVSLQEKRSKHLHLCLSLTWIKVCGALCKFLWHPHSMTLVIASTVLVPFWCVFTKPSPCFSWSGKPPPCWPGPAPCTDPGKRPQRVAEPRPPAPGRACRPGSTDSPLDTADTWRTHPGSRLCLSPDPYLEREREGGRGERTRVLMFQNSVLLQTFDIYTPLGN